MSPSSLSFICFCKTMSPINRLNKFSRASVICRLGTEGVKFSQGSHLPRRIPLKNQRSRSARHCRLPSAGPCRRAIAFADRGAARLTTDDDDALQFVVGFLCPERTAQNRKCRTVSRVQYEREVQESLRGDSHHNHSHSRNFTKLIIRALRPSRQSFTAPEERVCLDPLFINPQENCSTSPRSSTRHSHANVSSCRTSISFISVSREERSDDIGILFLAGNKAPHQLALTEPLRHVFVRPHAWPGALGHKSRNNGSEGG